MPHIVSLETDASLAQLVGIKKEKEEEDILKN
jgi:hypothetical protein